VSMLVSRRRSAATLVMAVLVALGATGCGLVGGDDKKTQTTTTPLPTLPPTTAAPASTATTTPQEYIVQSGDSLTKIAKMFGVTVASLVALNAIADPDKITEGQRIKIPPPTTTTAPGTPGPAPGATTTTAAPTSSSSG
jgi:LysM repeat protein